LLLAGFVAQYLLIAAQKDVILPYHLRKFDVQLKMRSAGLYGL